jgi:hypothetical protein
MLLRATKANVRVRVRRGIVQVQGKDPGVMPIVPIATTKENTARLFVFVLIKKKK